MVKRNTPKKQKRKPTTSGGTPQGGDRMKVRRMKEDKKLTENEQPYRGKDVALPLSR